jgi:hypothetical protein
VTRTVDERFIYRDIPDIFRTIVGRHSLASGICCLAIGSSILLNNSCWRRAAGDVGTAKSIGFDSALRSGSTRQFRSGLSGTTSVARR